MARIIPITQLQGGCFAPDPCRWTAVIPAAGRGSRLGYRHPKILYPVAGRPILDWLVELLSPFCSRLVFVVSPEGREQVAAHLERLGTGVCLFLTQEEPTGMGDAVLLAEAAVTTPNTLVIWGDQVGIAQATVLACMKAHARSPAPLLTLPTVIRERPYISIERDGEGRITRIGQRREEAIPLARGENDCGLFCFASHVLFAALRTAKREGLGVGAATGEFNLLPIIPMLDGEEGRVITVRLANHEEAIGVNTQEDAQRLAELLGKR